MGTPGDVADQVWIEGLEQSFSWDAVLRECADPLARITGILQHAALAGTLPRATLLCHLGEGAANLPELQEELQSGPLYQLLQGAFAAAVGEGRDLLGNATAVAHTAKAQADMGICYAPCWEALQACHVDMWLRVEEDGGHSAATVLYAHAKLFEMGLVDAADERLRHVFITGLVKHADRMVYRDGGEDILLSVWALGEEDIHVGDDVLRSITAVVERTRQHLDELELVLF